MHRLVQNSPQVRRTTYDRPMAYERPTKQQAYERLEALVARYATRHSEHSAPGSTFTETDARSSYIDPMLEAFGWDVRNEAGLPGRHLEVVMERVGADASGSWGRPDYRLRVDGKDRMPIEAKKPSVQLSQSLRSSQQARSYGWNLSLPAAILTNFAEFVVFDTQYEVSSADTARTAEFPGTRMHFSEYLSNFDTLWRYLSHETIASDLFYEVYSFTEPPRGKSPFDRSFLAEFRRWRTLLAKDIHVRNADLNAEEVSRRVQKILNALLFLRVCEDRDIQKYESLLESSTSKQIVAHFRMADRTFNAGVFDVLANIAISDEVLATVIGELYWPHSHFAFSMLKPEILASVYEQYLGERVVIRGDGNVIVQEKPELLKAGGVVHTPPDIVDEIVESTVSPLIDAGIPSALRVLDPAVGSGPFLLSVFRALVEVAEEHKGAGLNIAERGDIAARHLYGVDIDGAAVEVARLSLLLAVLGDDRPDMTASRGLLPSLAENVILGNSVVQEDFYDILPSTSLDQDVLTAVLPTSFEEAFGETWDSRGFDAIVGNPPYVRIQVLSEYLPHQLTYFQSEDSGYKASQGHSFDLYMIFLERALGLLSKTGRLGMIVPNRFLTSQAAPWLRGELAKRLERFIHFGEEQVFPGRSTYTSIIYLGSGTEPAIPFELVNSLPDWRESGFSRIIDVDRSELSSANWPIASPEQKALFDRLRASSTLTLGDKRVARIFVGVQTSADDIYFIEPDGDPTSETSVSFRDKYGRKRSIESALLRPAIRDRRIEQYDAAPGPDYWVIFPYEMVTTAKGSIKAVVLDPETLTSSFPLAQDYFRAFESELRERSVTPDPGLAFWAYGRSQNLTRLDDPKLIVRVLSLIPRYALDDTGLVAPGGGDGGPYYFIRESEDSPYSLSVIQAILSHPAVDLFVTTGNKKYRGSYAIHRKATLSGVPLPELDMSQSQEIEKSMLEIRDISRVLRGSLDARTRQARESRKAFLVKRLNRVISDAYGINDDLLAAALA